MISDNVDEDLETLNSFEDAEFEGQSEIFNVGDSSIKEKPIADNQGQLKSKVKLDNNFQDFDFTDSEDERPEKRDDGKRKTRSYDVQGIFVKKVGFKHSIMLDPNHPNDPDFGFVKDKTQGNTRYWRCCRRWKTGCKISAVTQDSMLKTITGVHSETSHEIKQSNKRLLNVEAVFTKGKEGSTILLDPDHPDDPSFMFVRSGSGKARGEVVYWQCRKKPCKVTAKTRGFILESIYGEHSDKSHMSLQSTQKRSPKNPKVREPQWSMNTPAKFSRSLAGGLILTDPNGMTYHKDKVVKNNYGELVYWRCRMSRYGCRAWAHTNSESVIVRITQEHTHGVDPPELVGKGNWTRGKNRKGGKKHSSSKVSKDCDFF